MKILCGTRVMDFTRRFKISQKRLELREKAVSYKGGKCEICKYDKCLAAFDFHHTDPLFKDFNISSKMTSWSTIKREIDKCVLLCSRCHREVHDGLHPGYLEDYDVARSQMDDLEIVV